MLVEKQYNQTVANSREMITKIKAKLKAQELKFKAEPNEQEKVKIKREADEVIRALHNLWLSF